MLYQEVPQGKEIALVYDNQYSEGDEGYINPEKLQWIEILDYPIERLHDAPDAKWFIAEQEMWAKDGQPERYNDMLDREIVDHIIVYDNGEGGYIWDGNHRIGARLFLGETTVKAFVGVAPELKDKVLLEIQNSSISPAS
ncbi:MAG: hypothetical protein ACOCUT_04070 [bacterium]